MRLRHIEIFHAIYMTGSITNAAQFLHVSQPSVSKVLAHAEMQLGFDLFQRVKGRLIPTAEAHMLFNEVDKVYKQIRSVRNTAENIKKSKKGNVNIGLAPALGFDLVPKAVAEFKKAHPDVNINIQTMHNEQVQQALLERKIDFALMFSPPPLPGITQQLVLESQLMVVYPNKFFPEQPQSMNVSQLINQEIIGIWDSGPLGDIVFNRISDQDIEMKCNIQVQTYFIAARLVAQEMGVCIIDEYTAKGNLCEQTSMAPVSPPLHFNLQALHLTDQQLSQTSKHLLDEINKVANA